VNQWWICNDGRYDYPHVHDDRRLAGPRRREHGELADVDWGRLPAELDRDLRGAGRLAAVLSPFLTVEEAYLLGKYVRQIDPQAAVVLGPVPVVGEDERFKNGFTISAEKCPNRRGVELVVAHFMGPIATLDDLKPDIQRGEIRGLWISGGYKRPWIDDAAAQWLGKAAVLVLQDLFPSPLVERATYVLPAAAFPERDGSYVNRYDHLQSVRWAIRPPSGVRPEGSLLWELLGMPGLYNARSVLSEIAAEVLYFAVAAGPIPDVGVNLKVNLLAKPAGTGQLA
jgi:NADH-quinone oxidoreductase subunit G